MDQSDIGDLIRRETQRTAAEDATKPADLKASRNAQASRTGHDRPKLSILQYNGMVYSASGTTFGSEKYARGNFHGPRPEGVEPVDRFLEYLDAAMRHIGKIAHAINVAKGTRGDQIAACALPDDEASGGFPASNLPHIAHAIAGLMIAVECGVADGLLPADPGQPWRRDPLYAEVLARRGAPAALPQKDDPDAEHRRVVEQSFVLPDKIPNTVAGRAVFASLAPELQVGYRPCVGDERLGVTPAKHAPRQARLGDRVRVTAGVNEGRAGTVRVVSARGTCDVHLDGFPVGDEITVAKIALQVIE